MALIDELFAHYPRLSFYYHLSPEQILKLPGWLRKIYIKQLDVILAEQEAAMLRAATYPHLTEEGRESTMSQLNERLRAGEAPRPKPGFMPLPIGIGIGFVKEPRRE